MNVLEWGKTISPENLEALRRGDVFVLLSKEGRPYSEVAMDTAGKLWERPISEPRPDHVAEARP